ncbi:MAG: hypothetical protein CMK00_08720 [Planctomycetes bacterium]|nr:hypothetical protein [Planctomycetota bacterium]
MGLVFGPGYMPAEYRLDDSRPERSHATEALLNLARDEKADQFTLIQRAIQSIPDGDVFFLPILEEILAETQISMVPSESDPIRPDPVTRLRGLWWERIQGDISSDGVETAEGAELFPGAVHVDAKRIGAIRRFRGASGEWLSTGLYAAPGEALRVRVKSGKATGWGLRIGAHSDSIFYHGEWRRWPNISHRFQLREKEVWVASPFGGLIYVVPAGHMKDEVCLQFSHVVPAPLFRSFESNAEKHWLNERDAPAPWAELAGEYLILTVPSEALRNLDDPARITDYWDRVIQANCQLGGRSLPDRPERFVADVQISAGYMHSGYPIMTHLDVTRPSDGHKYGRVLDIDWLEAEGSWGHFHELGHNRQRGEWTFDGAGEVTCNLFTLHAMDKVSGIEPWTHPFLDGAKEEYRDFIEKGADFEVWKREHALALLMYAQVQHAFGWEPFYAVFAEYESLPDDQRPRTDQGKRDQWLIRLSRAVDRNLGPFFVHWGIPVTEQALDQVSTLDPWMPVAHRSNR